MQICYQLFPNNKIVDPFLTSVTKYCLLQTGFPLGKIVLTSLSSLTANLKTKPLKIVNASAGSGKTYTLVQEYLRIILNDPNPMKFRSILAMTFTNKAANEMKSRILDGLVRLGKPKEKKSEQDFNFLIDTSKNLAINPAVIEERAATVLNRILHNYTGFSVMTIDKFTHRIIRTFAKDLNLSVDFDVELDIKGLRKSVTDLLFDQIGRNPELTNLMMRYARTNLNQDKSWNFANQVYEFSDLLFKEDAIQSIQMLRQLSANDFLAIQEELTAENARIQNAITSMAGEIIDLIRSKGLTQDDFNGKSRGVVPYFEKLSQGKIDKPSDTLYKIAATESWAQQKSPNTGVIQEISPLLSTYFNQLDRLIDSGNKKLIINREILKNLNNLSLLNYLLGLVEGVKEEQNVLLISDFYQKISEVILHEKVPFIYERMGVRFEYFLLDEFQDTSHLQWINMIPLIHNSLASGNLNLIVGDGKQAIYRWRNGEVEQFTGLPDKIYNPGKISSLLEAENQFRMMGESRKLEKNFRSATEIVRFNNELFRTISRNLSPLVSSIYSDVSQDPVSKHTGYIETWLESGLDETVQLGYISSCINRALEAGFEWGDICILVRSNNTGAKIADYLTGLEIKVISPDSLFIVKDQHVQFIFNLMCALAMPASKNYRIKSLELFAALLREGDPGAFISSIPENITEISGIMAREGFTLRNPAEFDNLYQFSLFLIREFKLDLAGNTYLQFFLEELFEFEKGNNSSVRDFAEWFESKGSEKSVISPEGSNAIQVMTIHKAKGLEFPVVICPFFDWRLDLSRQITWVENDQGTLPAYFVNMTRQISDTGLRSVYETEESKFYLDQLNLLYVAFTRPEQALFISGDTRKARTPASIWLGDYMKKLDWPVDESGRKYKGELFKPLEYKENGVARFVLDEGWERLPRPQLSIRNLEHTEDILTDEKRLFGIRLHALLAQLKSEEDLEAELRRSILNGTLEPEFEERLREQVRILFTDIRFREYFSAKSFNEKPILTPEGTKLIPDKLVFLEQFLLVVDFKTGNRLPEHKKQVQEYVHALKEMGYSKVRGEIYYTELMDVDPL